MKGTTIAISILAGSMLGASMSAGAAQVCANTVTGAITAKARCKGAEKPLNLNAILSMAQPPIVQEVAGVDISKCSAISSEVTSIDGAAVTGVTCSAGYFLMNYGYTPIPNSLPIESRQASLEYDGSIPVGVTVGMQQELTVTMNQELPLYYDLRVTGTCCPRT